MESKIIINTNSAHRKKKLSKKIFAKFIAIGLIGAVLLVAFVKLEGNVKAQEKGEREL